MSRRVLVARGKRVKNILSRMRFRYERAHKLYGENSHSPRAILGSNETKYKNIHYAMVNYNTYVYSYVTPYYVMFVLYVYTVHDILAKNQMENTPVVFWIQIIFKADKTQAFLQRLFLMMWTYYMHTLGVGVAYSLKEWNSNAMWFLTEFLIETIAIARI